MKSISEQIYQYLFLKTGEPFKNKWFNSFILEISSNRDLDNIVDMLEELFLGANIIKKDKEIIVTYYNDIDFSIKDVALSISDDFGVNTLVFSFPKLYVKENKFLDIYSLYKKYISNKKQGYFEISDLVLEIFKFNLEDAKYLKRVIFEKVLNDSQNENLIISMFENNLNVLKTSKNIYMHRNTINNKLEALRKETGMNILKFQDAVAMYLLIKMK